MSSELNSLVEEDVRVLVERLILDEKRLDEQRAFYRVPFCRPVTITPAKRDGMNTSARRVQWSASTRDISVTGVGLLSRIPVEPGSKFILTIPQRSGVPVILKTEMKWCAPSCDGWYIIGGRILEAIESPWERLDIVV